MAIVQNPRLVGLHGKLTLATDLTGGTDAYASADLRSWEITINATDVDLSAIDDVWDVGRVVTMSAEGSAEKAIVTIDFLKHVGPETQLKATFFRGDVTDAGAEVASGVVYITSWGTAVSRQAGMFENIRFKFTGAVTTAAT